MDPITWEIRYGLPAHKYIEYVNRNLLGSGIQPVDPFAPRILDKVNETYVPRDSVESEISQPGNSIILGNKGGGGTTLARWLANEMLYSLHSSRYQTLAVHLPISGIDIGMSGGSGEEKQPHLWTVKQLIACIFDVYWNQMVIEPLHRATLLPLLRKDREWMFKLHWFYNHYPPSHYQVIHDFELFTWLNSEFLHSPFSPQIADEDILRALIDFITAVPFDPRQVFGETFRWPYRKVMLIIDLTEDIPAYALDQLAWSIQELHTLSLARMEFKVFLNLRWERQVTEWAYVKSGYISVYRLPHWDAQALQDILDKRLIAYGGEFRDYDGNITNWGSSLPGLSPAVQYHFRQIVVDGALQAYTQPTDFDAPIHVLKLARGLIAACAGCWEERFPLRLNAHQLQEIVELYWGGGET